MSIENFLADPELLSKFHERTASWAHVNFIGGDVELIEAISAIHTLADIETVWSCASHPTETKHDEFMIMFAVSTEKRMLWLYQLYTQMQSYLVNASYEVICSFRLTIGRNIVPWGDTAQTYPTFVLSVTVDTEAEKQSVLTALSSTLSTLIMFESIQ